MIRDNETREERRKKEEERVRKMEEKLERVVRENEERWKERGERMRVMEDWMEREARNRRIKEWSRNREEEGGKNENKIMKERITAIEDRIRKGEKSPGKKDKEAHVRTEKLENDIAKDRAERQKYEWSSEGEKEVQDVKVLRRTWKRN